MHLHTIDNSWTLFLDRDGVLNREKKDDYILGWDNFIFLDGVKEALQKLSNIFSTIIVVTNQKCVGKKLLTVATLTSIHANMQQDIENAGGRIDAIYYCPDLLDTAPCRKPNAGMAFEAQKDFPSIIFSKSIMVGNKLSDMQFGRNATMHTVFIATTNPDTPFPHPTIDARYDNLLAFTIAVEKAVKQKLV